MFGINLRLYTGTRQRIEQCILVRPTASGRMARSNALLSISTRPSPVYRQSDGQRPGIIHGPSSALFREISVRLKFLTNRHSPFLTHRQALERTRFILLFECKRETSVSVSSKVRGV